MFNPSVEKFYSKHKEAILKLVATEHVSRVSHADLKFEFVAASGKRYYSFPEKMSLPLVRLAKNMEFIDWFRNGIDPTEMATVCDKMIAHLAYAREGGKDQKERINHAAVLADELNKRRLTYAPLIIIHNLAANNLIREDEDPSLFTNQMHAVKCDELEQEIESGNNAFFLTLPQLRIFSEIQSMSPPELTKYLQDLQTENLYAQSLMKKLISWKGAATATKTSKRPSA